MIVLKPSLIADAQFVSSTLPEADYATYSAATTYAATNRVIYNHKIYESLQAANIAHTPDATASITWWLYVGPTNRWAMFDQQINTASTSSTSSLQVVVTPGLIDSVALLESVGTSATVELIDSGITVYTQTKALDTTVIFDWSDYFFEPYDYADEVVFRDIPLYAAGQLRVTVNNTSGNAALGGLVPGRSYDLGSIQYGARAGIIDYSKKTTDTFGTVSIVKRSFSKRLSCTLILDNLEIRRVQRLLADLRATPCVWIGVPDNTDTYGPLVVFGFYRDFNIEVAYPTQSTCSLEIEGMI